MVLSVSLSVALSASLSVSFSVALPVGWPIVDRYTRVCGVVAGEGQEGKIMGGNEKNEKRDRQHQNIFRFMITYTLQPGSNQAPVEHTERSAESSSVCIHPPLAKPQQSTKLRSR